MKSIRWSRFAAKDLAGIVDWIIENHAAQQASSVVNEVDEGLVRAAEFPESGRIVRELEAQAVVSYRELIISPWRVIYRHDGTVLTVLAVFDGRRRIDDVLLRRNLR